jgi:hypothetical protein
MIEIPYKISHARLVSYRHQNQISPNMRGICGKRKQFFCYLYLHNRFLSELLLLLCLHFALPFVRYPQYETTNCVLAEFYAHVLILTVIIWPYRGWSPNFLQLTQGTKASKGAYETPLTVLPICTVHQPRGPPLWSSKSYKSIFRWLSSR